MCQTVFRAVKWQSLRLRDSQSHTERHDKQGNSLVNQVTSYTLGAMKELKQVWRLGCGAILDRKSGPGIF